VGLAPDNLEDVPQDQPSVISITSGSRFERSTLTTQQSPWWRAGSLIRISARASAHPAFANVWTRVCGPACEPLVVIPLASIADAIRATVAATAHDARIKSLRFTYASLLPDF
jgi:hypothetical protein